MKRGRPRKYATAAALEKAVDAYWNSISYEKPAVVCTPTGYVEEQGKPEYAMKLLTMNEDGSLNQDGTGRPKTVTEFIAAPSVAGLCLFLGISRDTWASYAKDEQMGSVCERFRLRHEAYLVDVLEQGKGKSVQGAIFSLKNNFGWAERVETEHSGGGELRMRLEDGTEEMAK